MLDRFNDDTFSSSNWLAVSRRAAGLRHRAGHLERAGGGLRSDLFVGLQRSLFRRGGGQAGLSERRAGSAAGWYTLLPAKYATLPGGMRVVEHTGATQRHAGSVIQTARWQLPRHRLLWRGRAPAIGIRRLRSFTVQSQAVFDKYSEHRTHLCEPEIRGATPRTMVRIVPQTARWMRDGWCSTPSDTLTIDTTLTDHAGQGRARRGGRHQRIDLRHRLDASGDMLAGRRHRADRRRTDQSECRKPSDRRRAHRQRRRHDVARPSRRTRSWSKTTRLIRLSGPEVVLAVDGSRRQRSLWPTARRSPRTATVTDTRTGDYLVDGMRMTGQAPCCACRPDPSGRSTRTNLDSDDRRRAFSPSVRADIEGASDAAGLQRRPDGRPPMRRSRPIAGAGRGQGHRSPATRPGFPVW